MKLPRIESTIATAENLPREPIYAPGRLFQAYKDQAYSKAASARKLSMSIAQNTAELTNWLAKMESDEAKVEAERTIRVFNEELREQVLSNPNLTEEEFNNLVKKTWEAKKKELKPLVANTIEKQLDSVLVPVRRVWFNQQLDQKRQKIVTSGLEAIDTAINTYDFTGAKNTLKTLQPYIKPSTFLTVQGKIQDAETIHNYKLQAEKYIQQPEKLAELKQSLLKREDLSERQKALVLSTIETEQLNQASSVLIKDIQAIKTRSGVVGVVDFLRQRMAKIVESSPEQLGGDLAFKNKILALYRQYHSVYNTLAQQKKAAASTLQTLNAVAKGLVILTPNDKSEADAIAAVTLGGQLDEKGRIVPGSINEPKLLANFEEYSKVIPVVKTLGFVPNYVGHLLYAGLFSAQTTPDAQLNSLEILRNVLVEKPDAIWRSSIPEEVKDLANMMQAMGLTKEGTANALALYQKYLQSGPGERQQYSKIAESDNKWLEDNKNKLLKQVFPDEGILWNSAPDTTRIMWMKFKDAYKKFLVMTQGDKDKAILMAGNTLKLEYGVENGKLVHHPITAYTASVLNAPTSVVNRAIETDKLGIIKKLYPDIEDPENVEFIPVPNFDPNEPKYIMQYFDQRYGMIRHLGLYDPKTRVVQSVPYKLYQIQKYHEESQKQEMLKTAYEQKKAMAISGTPGYSLYLPSAPEDYIPSPGDDSATTIVFQDLIEKQEKLKEDLYGATISDSDFLLPGP